MIKVLNKNKDLDLDPKAIIEMYNNKKSKTCC